MNERWVAVRMLEMSAEPEVIPFRYAGTIAEARAHIGRLLDFDRWRGVIVPLEEWFEFHSALTEEAIVGASRGSLWLDNRRADLAAWDAEVAG